MVNVDKKDILSYKNQVIIPWFIFILLAVILWGLLIFFKVVGTVMDETGELMTTLMLLITPLVFLPFAVFQTMKMKKAIQNAEKIVTITEWHMNFTGRMFTLMNDKEVEVFHHASWASFLNDYDQLEVLVTNDGKCYLLNPMRRKKKNAKKNK